jgi:hypothetical protein
MRTFEFRAPDGSVIARVAESAVHGAGYALMGESYELWVEEADGWRRVGSWEAVEGGAGAGQDRPTGGFEQG